MSRHVKWVAVAALGLASAEVLSAHPQQSAQAIELAESAAAAEADRTTDLIVSILAGRDSSGTWTALTDALARAPAVAQAPAEGGEVNEDQVGAMAARLESFLRSSAWTPRHWYTAGILAVAMALLAIATARGRVRRGGSVSGRSARFGIAPDRRRWQTSGAKRRRTLAAARSQDARRLEARLRVTRAA